MKLSRKLKWTLGLGSIITLLPLTVNLVSCGNTKISNDELSNNNFIANIKDINKTINNVDQEIYEIAKMIDDTYYTKMDNYQSNLNNSVIANNWLSNANPQKIEDLLFINFNRFLNINYDDHYDNKIKIQKSVIEISDVKYDSNNYIVDFVFAINHNFYDMKNNFDIPIELCSSLYSQYQVKNMKLLVYNDDFPYFPYDQKCPFLSIDTTNIEIENLSVDLKTNIGECWNNIKQILINANNTGDKFYNGQIVSGEYYNQLITTWNNYAPYFYEFDKNYNINYKGLKWTNEDFINDFDYHCFAIDIFAYHQNFGCKFDDNLNILKDKLWNSCFLVAEFNSNKSDFNLIDKI